MVAIVCGVNADNYKADPNSFPFLASFPMVCSPSLNNSGLDGLQDAPNPITSEWVMGSER